VANDDETNQGTDGLLATVGIHGLLTICLYTPDDVLQHAMVRDHVGIYALFYSFTGFYTVTWTASAGFDRTETYVDTDRTFKDGNPTKRDREPPGR
jgi:hypothetical protein